MRNRKRLICSSLAAATLAVVGAVAGIGSGSAFAAQRPHHRVMKACPPVPLWANTGGGDRLIEYNSLTGAELHNVPLAQGYGDIAFSSDGKSLFGVTFPGSPVNLVTINTATGAEIATTAITGPAAAAGNLNALTALPSGMLLVASSTSQNLWTIDPHTGASTTLAAQFPTGFTSAGDVTVLGDGDILALGTSGTVPTAAFRIHPDNSVTEIGTLPSSFGVAQSGSKVYVFTADGHIDRLNSVPTAASTAPLSFTVLTATGHAFLGASSVQDTGTCIRHRKRHQPCHHHGHRKKRHHHEH